MAGVVIIVGLSLLKCEYPLSRIIIGSYVMMCLLELGTGQFSDYRIMGAGVKT